ncbi:hypothetical protein NW768_007994 [Fusarium equiseti]|uniref:F-box protein n=1 Tax=Fusarium equiseti TaxID=61235 RepID=A0ABQ8R605_FUSEQ|nr:hypothetical protein NW768_007994 [Fusarium equiseti]
MTGFTQFVCDFLPKDIMNYLANVKHLRLAASELSVFGAGIYGDSYYSLDMFPLTGRIPTLLSLELKNIVLGDTFMIYLQTQADNLRELTLHNCMCLSPTDGPFDEWPHTEAGEVQWSDIWACILLRIPAMRRVTFVQNEQPPLPPAYSRLVEEMLEAGEDLTVWRYITIDEDWGNVHEDEEANFEEVRLGNACTIYGEMMKVLADRRESEESADEE